MSILGISVRMFLLTMMVACAGVASGQAYPSKPVRITTYSVGGSNDFAARLLADGLAAPLGQPVIVDNRAGSVIPGEVVSKAPPDGYTILVAGGIFTILHLLQETPYDPIRDFVQISLIGISPLILVVHPSLPVKSVKDLIAMAKAKPGDLNYAAGGLGGTSHLSMELFKSMARVNIQNVPYKGGGAALIDLLGGQVHMTIDGSQLLPHVKTGKLRALGVTSAQPSPLFPGMPTIASSGVPGYEAISMLGVFAPAKTPAAIVNRLNQEIVRLMKLPDVREKFLNSGIDAVGSTPEEHAAKYKSEVARWGAVIKSANIRVN
jgi:tripartite-type tricarboxylate transporter receptor subunit TctC